MSETIYTKSNLAIRNKNEPSAFAFDRAQNEPLMRQRITMGYPKDFDPLHHRMTGVTAKAVGVYINCRLRLQKISACGQKAIVPSACRLDN